MSPNLARLVEVSEKVLIDNYLRDNLYENDRYKGSKRITQFHKSVYAQNGEDGIIEEIFRRIGVDSRIFVEFGVHGLKNNSTYLLVKGWQGLWIGAKNARSRDLINAKLREVIATDQLTYRQEWITRENIETIFSASGIPERFDLLSIDLDGNDFWIWESIEKFKPRVVAIEYNALFPSDVHWMMTYNETHRWDGSSYFGASLKALETLAGRKGYLLIGCDFAGCNAFFLHQDEDHRLFEAPFSAEHHYEPPRYFLRNRPGHPLGFGPFLVST